MPDKAVAQAVVAETRRVLDRQHIQTRNPRRRPRRRPVHNLLHRHLVIAQKPPDPHLARSTAPQTPHRKTPRTLPHKAIMQKPIRPVHPPVPKNAAPDHPSTPLANPQSPSNARNQNHHQSANPTPIQIECEMCALRGRQGGGQRPRNPSRSRRIERPSPSPFRKREGRRRGSRLARPSSPACGGGREGGQRPRSPARPHRVERPSPSPSRKQEGRQWGSRLVFLPSPVCGGGRVGVSGRPALQGPIAWKDPPPVPPVSGRGEKEGAAAKREGRRERSPGREEDDGTTAADPLLPR